MDANISTNFTWNNTVMTCIQTNATTVCQGYIHVVPWNQDLIVALLTFMSVLQSLVVFGIFIYIMNYKKERK